MKNILAKLFGGAGGSIAEKISGIIDKHTFSKVEKAQFEKEMEEIFIKAEADMQQNVTDRWKTDMNSDSWLSKNVRPLILVWCIVVFSLAGILDSIDSVPFHIGELWNDTFEKVMMAVVLAYFGGRTTEKATSIFKK
tara:strand:+ start:627 stop:1037 length:411 start_codon:yes stop_codon:yes gene_type:complete